MTKKPSYLSSNEGEGSETLQDEALLSPISYLQIVDDLKFALFATIVISHDIGILESIALGALRERRVISNSL